MVIPLIGLILGLALLIYAALSYLGNEAIANLPEILQRRGRVLWFLGCFLLAAALMLGFIGYLGWVSAPTLRHLRLVLGLSGIILLALQLLKPPRTA